MARDTSALRTEVLRRMRSFGPAGATAVDFSGLYSHHKVKDGHPARHVACAGRMLCHFARQGQVLRLTGPGRHARYCITAAGLSWLEDVETGARAAAGRSGEQGQHPDYPPELPPPRSIFENTSPDEPPAGLFD